MKAPKVEPTQSKRPSSKGSASTSASTHSTSKPSASVRARPRSTMPGEMSDATTLAPSRAHAIVKLPVPAPTSSTSCPAETAHASQSAVAAGSKARPSTS